MRFYTEWPFKIRALVAVSTIPVMHLSAPRSVWDHHLRMRTGGRENVMIFVFTYQENIISSFWTDKWAYFFELNLYIAKGRKYLVTYVYCTTCVAEAWLRDVSLLIRSGGFSPSSRQMSLSCFDSFQASPCWLTVLLSISFSCSCHLFLLCLPLSKLDRIRRSYFNYCSSCYKRFIVGIIGKCVWHLENVTLVTIKIYMITVIRWPEMSILSLDHSGQSRVIGSTLCT